jgi:hypothetical protein
MSEKSPIMLTANKQPKAKTARRVRSEPFGLVLELNLFAALPPRSGLALVIEITPSF